MISKMTKYSFILLSGDKDSFVDRLGDLGLVDIVRSTKPVDETSAKLAGEIDLVNGLIQDLNKIEIPEGTEPIPYQKEGKDAVRLASATLMRHSEAESKVKALQQEAEDLRVWGSFNTETIQKLAEAGIPIHFHRLSEKQFQPQWEKDFALSVINRTKAAVYFVVAGEDSLPGEIPAPSGDHHALKARLAEEEKNLRVMEGRIAALKMRIPEFEESLRNALSRLDLYLAGVSATPAAEDTIVTMVGYAPEQDDAAVTAALEEAGVFYLKEAAAVEDRPPIHLKNNKFTKMFTVLTDMYGRPQYNGFDPTPYISVFFMLFFAFCMGDAGYGLVLTGVGLLLRKAKGAASFAPLVTVLGVATTVIGFLFHTFFSIDIAQWECMAPFQSIFLPSQIAGYDGTMVLAILVGIFHICLALVVKTIYATKNNSFLGSLGTWGWTLLIVGSVVVGGFALLGVIDAALTKWILIALGILSAIGIFFLNDLHRNPMVNFGAGLWETYNTATGLLGDVLSYLRLYALGLAGAKLGFAFNELGAKVLGDGAAANWIFFILIIIIGHTLNVAMAALGAFVHPLRLNFLEFFKNSGYEGGARIYDPVKKVKQND